MSNSHIILRLQTASKNTIPLDNNSFVTWRFPIDWVDYNLHSWIKRRRVHFTDSVHDDLGIAVKVLTDVRNNTCKSFIRFLSSTSGFLHVQSASSTKSKPLPIDNTLILPASAFLIHRETGESRIRRGNFFCCLIAFITCRKAGDRRAFKVRPFHRADVIVV